jgi:hypothetical protein
MLTRLVVVLKVCKFQIRPIHPPSRRLSSALMARRRGGRRSAANALVKTWARQRSDERAQATSGRATREGEEQLTGWARLSGAGARSWAREGEGGSGRERGGKWLGPENGPAEGGEFFPFPFSISIFYFSFLFSISISFYLLFF